MPKNNLPKTPSKTPAAKSAPPAKHKSPMRPSLLADIIILHGENNDLAGWLIAVIKAIGLTAGTPDDFRSKLPRTKSVDFLVESCRLPIVLLSPESEDLRKNTRAASNVYSAIGRLLALKRNDAIVLHEVAYEGDNKIKTDTEDGTNISFKTIEFERPKAEWVIPKLLTEIRQKGLITARTNSKGKERITTGRTLNAFLDRMDGLWDENFDVAWDAITGRDYKAERDFAASLDKFFQCYARAIRKVITKGITKSALTKAIDKEYDKAVVQAAEAWASVARAKADQANKEANSQDPSIKPILQKAEKAYRQAIKEEDPSQKSRLFRQAVTHFDEFLN